MAAAMERTYPHAPGRWHAFLLAAAFPLFSGALLCDWAYRSSHEIQWSNFAAWLLAGGMVFLGIALLCALIDVFRAGRRNGRSLLHFALVLVAFVLGFVGSFVHARDAWGVMPTGLVLTLLATLLVAAATWMAFAGLPAADRGARP